MVRPRGGTRRDGRARSPTPIHHDGHGEPQDPEQQREPGARSFCPRAAARSPFPGSRSRDVHVLTLGVHGLGSFSSHRLLPPRVCSCSAGVSLAGRREACGRAAPDGSKGSVQPGPRSELAPPLPRHCAYGRVPAPGLRRTGCAHAWTDGRTFFFPGESVDESIDGVSGLETYAVRVLHYVRTGHSLVVPRQHESNFDRPGETDPSPTLPCGC